MLEHLKSWIDERTGLSLKLSHLANVAMPGGARWRRVFGHSMLILIALEVLTGVAMMTVYTPSTTNAWSSTWYIETVLPLGHLVRGAHHFGAHAIVVLLGLHVMQTVFDRAGARPRELNHLMGLGIAGLVVFELMTGFPLAWDQRGYWVSRIETGIIGSAPVVGPMLQRFLVGGLHYGQLTITRFYTLHVALVPLALAMGILAHLAMVRTHGLVGDASKGDPDARWWPSQAARDAVAALVTLLAVLWAAHKWGAPLDAPADGASQYPAVPEWFFMPLSQLLKHFSGRWQIVGTMVIPGALSAYVAALPWVDRAPTLSRRLPVLLPLVVAGFAAVGLGMELAHHTHEPAFARSVHAAEATARRARNLARAGIPPEGPLEMLHNDPAVRPRELFVQYCGSCHAVRGASEQRTGPTLDGFGSREWASAFVAWPDRPIFMGTTQIHDMPAQHRRLHDDGLRAVSEWLYSRGVEEGDPPADAALVAQGETIYRRRCTTCHQGQGDTSGTESTERDAPDLDVWASREWLRAQMLNPGAGVNYGARNHMPRFGDRVTDRELNMILDYVRSLRRTAAPPFIDEPADP